MTKNYALLLLYRTQNETTYETLSQSRREDEMEGVRRSFHFWLIFMQSVVYLYV